MLDLIIDLYQQQQIDEAQRKAQQAKNRSEISQQEIGDLQRKADALTIACQALWEIVQLRLGVDQTELLKKMQEIDGRDGAVDGKIGHTLLACNKCKRKTSAKRSQCLYCGTVLSGGHLFEKT